MSTPAVARERPRPYTPGTRPELFERPAIFLSASVPSRRPGDLSPEEREQNERYVESARPDRIRAAITELCRVAFRRGFNFIFGGHPAISPMVLAAAKRFIPAGEPGKRVIVFQSLHFWGRLPIETLTLGDWECGELLWTEALPGKTDREAQGLSLRLMRDVMLQSPRIVAAVCIGGMEGVVGEARLFREHHSDRPLFAIGSTGSAAREVMDRKLADTSDGLTFALLMEMDSYPVVMQRLFDEITGLTDFKGDTPE